MVSSLNPINRNAVYRNLDINILSIPLVDSIVSETPVKFAENNLLDEITSEHELGVGELVLGKTKADVEKVRIRMYEGISRLFEKIKIIEQR